MTKRPESDAGVLRAAEAATIGSSPKEHVFKSFEQKRIDSAKLSGVGNLDFRQFHLTDVSGKGLSFEGADFSYTRIVRGYFHGAKFVRCKFVGSKIDDSNFRGAEFRNCDFRYSDLIRTKIDTDELIANAPDEPNIRREFFQILRMNALSLGDVSSSRRFVLEEIGAREDHLRRAWRGDGSYYRDKYSDFKKKASILSQILLFRLDSFFWGHGERPWKIAYSTLIFLVFAAILSVFSWATSQNDPSLSSIWSAFLSSLEYNVALFLDVPAEPPIVRLRFIDWSVVIMRYVVFGVLVSVLFRWMSHR